MSGIKNSGMSANPEPVSTVHSAPDKEREEHAGFNDAMAPPSAHTSSTGLLIINADDWGRDRETSDRILECAVLGAVSSVSAMVFMVDSERAASVAKERGIDAGLHLNLSLPFSAPECPPGLLEHQRRVASYLLKHPLARVVFHPGMSHSFEYVVKAQLEEFERLYGNSPERIDGHHHLHLSANVLLGRLLPSGTIVRRNFYFAPGEKSLVNRLYRKGVDSRLARRHRLVDFLFPLAPLQPRERLERLRSMARQFVIEVETHPVNSDELLFLKSGDALRWAGDVAIASHFSVRESTKLRVLGAQQ
jgi:hypothetical protein